MPTTPDPDRAPGAGVRPPAGSVDVRLATVADADAIRTIYNVEVAHHTSTFDLVERSLAEQRQWLAARSGVFSAVVAALDPPRDGADPTTATVVGFAALSPYKERAAYRTTVENSVYVSREHAGAGIGTALLLHTIQMARDSGFHAIIARIEASGAASRGLHASCGFELVGVEREVGRKFNRWLDVAIMQLML